MIILLTSLEVLVPVHVADEPTIQLTWGKEHPWLQTMMFLPRRGQDRSRQIRIHPRSQV